MPCYSMGHFLEESLDSVYKQSFSDFIVVIADDASPSEDSRELLAQINYPRCKIYFEKKNLGLVRISNKYMSMLDAEYILLLSPDDKLHPDFIKEHVDYLESHPNVHAVCSWIQEFGDGNQLITYSDELCKLPHMLVNNYFSGAALIRKSAWIAAGMHDTNNEIYPNVDWGVWLAMLERGFNLATISKPLFYWRIDRKSISHGVSAEQTLIFRKAIFKRHAHLYKKHLGYVLNFYFEKIKDFEKYYELNEEGHAWLDAQYHSLTEQITLLTEENMRIKSKLENSIELPLFVLIYNKVKHLLRRFGI